MRPRYDILAIDLDGTLLNSRGEISEPDRLAIARAEQAGLTIVVATGRAHAECRHVLEALDHRGLLAREERHRRVQRVPHDGLAPGGEAPLTPHTHRRGRGAVDERDAVEPAREERELCAIEKGVEARLEFTRDAARRQARAFHDLGLADAGRVLRAAVLGLERTWGVGRRRVAQGRRKAAANGME